ncbi:MAG: phosphatidate cytidylyltransferase [Candidatus Binatales bacterium]
MLRTRVLTALVALPAVLVLVVLPSDWLFTVLIGGLGAVGLSEIGLMTGARRPGAILILLAAGGAPMALMLYRERGSWIAAAAVLAAMLALTAMVAISGADGDGEGLPLTILGALYVGITFPYFALLRNREDGIRSLILMLLLVIASDTGAYFAGRSLGRIKLARKVSPNKTVEGALGGLMLAVAAGWLLGGWLAPSWPLKTLLVASAAIGAAAQLGDLANSAYKRVAGVKDSGWIFPGHGGLLDRASSLVFAAVFTYYYSTW